MMTVHSEALTPLISGLGLHQDELQFAAMNLGIHLSPQFGQQLPCLSWSDSDTLSTFVPLQIVPNMTLMWIIPLTMYVSQSWKVHQPQTAGGQHWRWGVLISQCSSCLCCSIRTLKQGQAPCAPASLSWKWIDNLLYLKRGVIWDFEGYTKVSDTHMLLMLTECWVPWISPGSYKHPPDEDCYSCPCFFPFPFPALFLKCFWAAEVREIGGLKCLHLKKSTEVWSQAWPKWGVVCPATLRFMRPGLGFCAPLHL